MLESIQGAVFPSFILHRLLKGRRDIVLCQKLGNTNIPCYIIITAPTTQTVSTGDAESRMDHSKIASLAQGLF